MDSYTINCQCGNIEISIEGSPKVRGFCHCEDCRDLLNTPYHAVNAWEKQFVEIVKGEDQLMEYQHPRLNMKKFFCQNCNEVMFNSNGMDWRVFSQFLISKNCNNKLPEELESKSHFFYARRIVDVNDDLPKRD